jgi:hypothetical protein
MPSHASLEEGDAGYCAAEWEQEAVQRGEDRNEATPPSPEALLTDATAIGSAGARPARHDASTEPGPLGVSSSLERPPRRF